MVNKIEKLITEFIKELEYNKRVSEAKGIETRVDIQYVVERLENILEEI